MACQPFVIGAHVAKQKTLPKTLGNLVSPVQIFLGGPTTFRIKDVADSELAETCALVSTHGIQLFIHGPYVVNLADPRTSEKFMPCLLKHLAIGSAIGARGVVVHVGKHCNRFPCQEVARNHMKIAIHEIIRESAAAGNRSCPFLLETPAGQGTELLTKPEDFIDFALEITYELTDQERLLFGICIDTCHVFASGTCPVDYLNQAMSKAKPLVKLIHFNDSLGDCGSCVDRHAALCCGKIGQGVLETCARIAYDHGVPMVTE